MNRPANEDPFGWLGPRAHDPRTIPERSLWTLVGHGRTVEARTRIVPLGPELRVYVDGELLWSQVIRDGSLEALSADTRAHWAAKGDGPPR